MLTAALQGLAVHVTPSLPATVQYTTGGHPEWQTNFTEVLSRLWQPRSPDGDVLTVFVEVGKTASTTVHKTFRDTIEATGSFCIIDFANDPKPCFGSAIVFGVPFGACSALAPGSRCQSFIYGSTCSSGKHSSGATRVFLDIFGRRPGRSHY